MRTPRRLLAIIPVFAVSFLILCGYVGYKFDHIYFLYFAPKLTNQPAIPISPMPDSHVPDHWKRCRLGAAKFSLPPECLEKRRVVASFMVLSAPKFDIMVSGGTDATAMMDAQRSQFPVWFARAGDNPIRLNAIAFQASRSQFRWGLSRTELRDLNNILGYKFFSCSRWVVAGEEMEGNGISGLLTYYDFPAGEFQWISLSQTTGGSMLFEFHDRQAPIDKALIRSICASFECIEHSEKSDWSEQEIEKSFKVIDEKPK